MKAHHHAHTPSTELTSINKAFLVGIVLNMAFVVVEAVTGFFSHSLALLSDAGHNLSDVASLSLSLVAFRLAKIKATANYTYGFRKATVLVALLNAIILLLVIGSIGYEAIVRLNHPQPVPGKTIAIVAFIGIIVNSITAYLFLQDKEKDLNVKSAYLHLAADALVSLGVVIGGVLILFTNWLWLDSVISLAIALVILFSTWGVLMDSLRLSLDGVPHNVDLEKIKAQILTLPGVADFHHIHVWAISTTKNALTAHLVIKDTLDLQAIEKLKDKVKHELAHLNVHHSTIEVHTVGAHAEEEDCQLVDTQMD